MADIFHDGTFQWYKICTDKLVDWLQKKAIGKSLETTTTKKLKQYAVDIVSKTPAVTVPPNILSAVDDAIKGRELFSAWYTDDTSTKTDKSRQDQHQSDRQHRYFINALVDIKNTLQRSRTGATAEEDLSGFIRPKKRGAPASRFDSVPVPVKNGYRQLIGDEDELKDTGITSIVTRIEDDDLQNTMALWAYLKDAQAIRQHMKAAWGRYLDGKLSMRAVTHLTEEASNLLYMIHREVEPLYDAFSSLGNFRALLETAHDSKTGSSTGSKDKKSDLDDLLCVPAFCALHWLRNTLICVTNSNFEPISGFGLDVPYPTHPFAHALIAIAPELSTLVRPIKGDISELEGSVDNYTFSLLKLSEEHQFRMWLVCATQIHMDIWDTLKGDMARGFCHAMVNIWEHQSEWDDCEKQVSSIHAAVKELLGTRGISHDALFKSVMRDQQREGQAGWLVEASFGPRQPPRSPMFLPETLLRILPVLSQYTTRRMLIDRQHCAAEMQNNDSIFIACMHLYRALQRCHQGKYQWQDMETVVWQQRTDSTLADFQQETSLKDIARQLSLHLGTEAALIRGNKTPPLPSYGTTKNKTPNLEAIDTVNLCEGYTFDDDNVLSVKSYYTALRAWMKAFNVDIGRDIGKELSSAWNAKQLTPTQILDMAEFVFVCDDNSLWFRHIKFTQNCIMFVGDVLEATGMLPRRTAGHASDLRESIYSLVHDLLWRAALLPGVKDKLKAIKMEQIKEFDGLWRSATWHKDGYMIPSEMPKALFDDRDTGRVVGKVESDANSLPRFLNSIKRNVKKPARARDSLDAHWPALRASFTFYKPWAQGKSQTTAKSGGITDWDKLITCR
ncbi:hypothetical protein Slin14017_G104730 [Septoria linicola]|nr:hypothetical protein Slin14017_G104730 [Septoria linicola]